MPTDFFAVNPDSCFQRNGFKLDKNPFAFVFLVDDKPGAIPPRPFVHQSPIGIIIKIKPALENVLMDTIGTAVVIVRNRDRKPVPIIKSNFMPFWHLCSLKFPFTCVDGIMCTLKRGLRLDKGTKNPKCHDNNN